MRVVLDTNVIVSGMFFDGKPGKILQLAEQRTIIPCFTIATFKELEHVLSYGKFRNQRALLPFTITEFLHELGKYSLLFPTPLGIPAIIMEDETDNHFLACAIIARARYIVSGDKHLLTLKKFHHVPILTASAFLKELGR